MKWWTEHRAWSVSEVSILNPCAEFPQSLSWSVMPCTPLLCRSQFQLPSCNLKDPLRPVLNDVCVCMCVCTLTWLSLFCSLHVFFPVASFFVCPPSFLPLFPRDSMLFVRLIFRQSPRAGASPCSMSSILKSADDYAETFLSDFHSVIQVYNLICTDAIADGNKFCILVFLNRSGFLDEQTFNSFMLTIDVNQQD